MSEGNNVIDLAAAAAGHAAPERESWFQPAPREIAPADWARYRAAVAEIFDAFGMDLDTPGTRDTPRRFLQAMVDATGGYDGDPKLRTVFPAEHSGEHACPDLRLVRRVHSCTSGWRSQLPPTTWLGSIDLPALSDHSAHPAGRDGSPSTSGRSSTVTTAWLRSPASARTERQHC